MTTTRRHTHCFAHASLYALALALGACNGRLDVTDRDIGGLAGLAGNGGSSAGAAGAAGSGGSAGAAGAAGSAGAGGTDEGGCTNGAVECDSGVCLDGVCQAPTCADGVRNGDEDGIDCGGACGPCLTLCQHECAVSDALIPLGCDPSAEAPVGVASLPRANEDGSIIAFDYCFADSHCTPMYWTASDGPRALPIAGGALLNGMSEDGLLLLANPQGALGGQALLLEPDGASAPAGIAPSPTIVSASGSLVGVSLATANALSLLRHPRAGDVENLGELPFGRNQFTLTAASGDASVVAGYSFGDTYQPFRYSDEGGFVFGLDGLPEAVDGATVTALSRNGQAFAGVTMLGSQARSVYRFTQADGLIELGSVVIPTPGVDPSAMALSDDGSVLAFSRETDAASGDFSAFRWTSTGGAQALTPGVQSVATLVSGDGRLIVGQTMDGQSFIWSEARGARSVRADLESAGVDLRGWDLGAARSLSHDGKVALGVGTCGGITTVYRLVLPE